TLFRSAGDRAAPPVAAAVAAATTVAVARWTQGRLPPRRRTRGTRAGTPAECRGCSRTPGAAMTPTSPGIGQALGPSGARSQQLVEGAGLDHLGDGLDVGAHRSVVGERRDGRPDDLDRPGGA